jgi:hypothetical protein
MAAGRGHLRVGRCGLDRWSEPCSVASMISDLMECECHTTKLRDFIMDNVTSSPDFPNTCVIKLDQHQYSFYKKSRLEIRAPNGKALTVISGPLPNKTEADAVFQLWGQACLLEVLFDEIQDKIKLPQKAINDIVRIIDRIDLHLRKQMRM